MMHKAWYSIEEVPYFFQGHSSNFKVTQDKKFLILTGIECFQTVTQSLQFEFTDGFEMMHKAWCSIEEVPYCFWGHPSNFKVTQAEKSTIWIQFV